MKETFDRRMSRIYRRVIKWDRDKTTTQLYLCWINIDPILGHYHTFSTLFPCHLSNISNVIKGNNRINNQQYIPHGQAADAYI